MSEDNGQLDAFATLVAEYLDGRAGEREIAELRGRLRDEPACRDIYVAVCLQSRLMRETLPERIAADDAGAIPAEPTPTATAAARGTIWRIRPLRAAALLAAAVAIGAAVVAVYVHALAPAVVPNPDPARHSVAIMIDSVDAVWTSEPIAPGASVPAQAVALTRGSVDFELSSGVALTVAGPADVTLDSERRTTVRRGLVIAEVPHGMAGYRVAVPGGGQVTDLGTRFAVLVDAAGRSFVYVLEGVVEYAGPDGAIAAPPIRATAGQGLVIDASGSATATAAAATTGVPEAMRRSLRRFELAATRSWRPTDDDAGEHKPSAPPRIDRPFDGLDLTDGLTIEAAFRVDDASRWNDTTNWTLLRHEHAHRVLLALQASRFIGAREGRAASAAPAPGISFGLFNGSYGELDVALDGEGGRPRFTDLLDGRVHHVVAVYDAQRLEKAIYLDGRRVGREAVAAGQTLRVPVDTAGARAPAAAVGEYSGESFGGTLLGVAIYDGPMPQRQIEQRAERWRSEIGPNESNNTAAPAIRPTTPRKSETPDPFGRTQP